MKPSVRRFFQASALALAVAAAASALAMALFRGASADRPSAPLPGAGAPSSAAASAAPGSLLGLAPVLEPAGRARGALSARFRLAGTIFGASTGGAEEPMAIIDDRELVRQHVVTRSEEVVPGVTLVAVGPDSATLAGPDGEETLALARRDSAPRAAPARAPEASASPKGAGRPRSREEAAERFGGREVFPDRWQFDREKVISYYEELRSQPERLLSVFDSMDPVYVEDPDGERRIEGYQVGVEGESDLFLAAGLEEGDIVRSVNSVLMARRDRAEALIAAFVEGRASMFVFEVERKGETKKLVFEIE